MKLAAWIQERIDKGIYTHRKDAYRMISGSILAQGGETVSAFTIENTARGMRLKQYSKAKAISVATEGKVSVEELCE